MNGKKTVLFIPGAPETIYSNDVHHRYRPASNIRYLCGFDEPAALLVDACGGEADGFTLFVQPRDPAAETWTGRRAGVEGACADYDADHAYPLSEVYEVLERHLRKADILYYAHSRDRSINERITDLVHRVNLLRPRTGGTPIVVTDASVLLDDMRLRKNEDEIRILRSACRISAGAHRRAYERARPGMYEYQVEALIEQAMRHDGCAGPAYGTIVASGANATVLHYTRNDRRLEDGDLLLIDAGGEYGGYCADITRTVPVGAAFSPAQAEIYDAVLAAQKAAIHAVAPGVRHDEIHRTALRSLVESLIASGLLQGSVDESIQSEAYKTFYMHNTSHWLGMDVHDVGSYREGDAGRTLEPGMVLTVEPGIYIREDAQVPERYRGIGIRIEDDVLVTPMGHEVLTADLAKDRRDIEGLRRRAFEEARA
jgi:Xaa-Pro aminopeptidase